MNLSELMFVMIVTLITWGGIFIYLLKIDRKLSRLEKELGEE